MVRATSTGRLLLRTCVGVFLTRAPLSQCLWVFFKLRRPSVFSEKRQDFLACITSNLAFEQFPNCRSDLASVSSFMRAAHCSSAEQGKRSAITRGAASHSFRNSKLVTTIVSKFTAEYTYLWPSQFPETPLSKPLPSFDGRTVLYPSFKILRDYLSWRQADCKLQPLCI